MSSPKEIIANNFTYHLPESKIAKFPIIPKHDSKLLVYKKGSIYETIFKKIEQEIEEGSLIILNNTKVLQARIIFEKETGGRIEIFCLQPGGNKLWHQALSNKGSAEIISPGANCLVSTILKADSSKPGKSWFEVSLIVVQFVVSLIAMS